MTSCTWFMLVGWNEDRWNLTARRRVTLGANIFTPHTRMWATDQQINRSGIHVLACRKSAGRYSAVNDLIKNELYIAPVNIASMLESKSLPGDDGKQLVWRHYTSLSQRVWCMESVISRVPILLAAESFESSRSNWSPTAVANDAESHKFGVTGHIRRL